MNDNESPEKTIPKLLSRDRRAALASLRGLRKYVGKSKYADDLQRGDPYALKVQEFMERANSIISTEDDNLLAVKYLEFAKEVKNILKREE
jgi:hypothetical protein